MAYRFCIAWLAAVVLCCAPVRADVQGRAEEMIRAAGLGSPKVSVMAVDLDSGETIVQIMPDTPMIPASNMKLVTSAAALGILGPDFVFETQLQLVPGDKDTPPTLVIKGDGDPGFGDPRLLEQYAPEIGDIESFINIWVDAVAATGVTEFERLVVDDRVFDREFIHPTWPTDQLNEWYCAQVAGFNFFDNCLVIKPHPTRVGEAPTVTIEPVYPGLNATNRATTVSGRSSTFWVSRRMGTNEMTFRGNVPLRGSGGATVTVHDPPLTFGEIFRSRLALRGITVGRVDRAGEDDLFVEPQVLHRVRTPLQSVLERCNKNSQNLFADALLKRMGRQYTGAAGGWGNGAGAVRAFLSEQAVGPAAAAAVNIADGSGLSRDNRITTRVITDLLAYMHENEALGDAYKASLSVAGVDGSLTRRLDRDITGQVLGKTGFINRVGSLSGYLVLPAVVDDTGREITARRTIAFSIIINDARAANHEMHQLQDRLVRLIDQAATMEQRRTVRVGGERRDEGIRD